MLESREAALENKIFSACCVVGLLCSVAPAWAQIDAASVATERQLRIQNLDVVGSQDVIPGKEASSVPEEEKQENLFGGGGYLHPYISVTARYSDNVYRTPDNTRSDWATIISPGIWVAVPARRQSLVSITTSTTTPAGLALFLERPEAFSRYQLYGMYGADMESYQEYSELDNTKHGGEVFGQYNFRGGLSLNAYDKYLDSEDPIRTGDSSSIDKFKSNLIGLVADYDITQKVGVRVDYNNYALDYDEKFNALRNRTDDALSFYGIYYYSPKTSLFVEYRYTDIERDTYTLLDSVQHSERLGFIYKSSEKTTMISKVGSVQKDFDNTTIDSANGLDFELQMAHAFTQKTSIRAVAQYTPNETAVSTASHQDLTNFLLNYTQLITDKLTGTVMLGYTINDYIPLAGQQEREDKIYSISPGLQYALQEWLQAGAGYSFIKRESTDPSAAYDENLFYVRLGAGL